MLRLVIAGSLIAALGACSRHEGAPAVEPGAAAGNVVEVTGTVTATGPAGTRTLQRGDRVDADDAIDTGTGSVAIVLAHNAARWELGPDHHGAKVRESPAWKLARQDRVAKPVDVETTPAGREAEHTAVDTVATTSSKPEEDRARREPAKPAAPPPPPPPPPPTIQPTHHTDSVRGGDPGGRPDDDGLVQATPNVAQDKALRACLTAKAHLVIACASSTCTVTSREITEPVRACLVARLNAMKLADLSLTLELAR